MKFPILIVAVVTMFTVASSAAPGPTTLNSSEQLVYAIEQASQVEIAYSPRIATDHRIKTSKEQLDREWDVSIIVRCKIRCVGRASKLVALLQDSFPVTNQCEYFRIKLVARDKGGKVIATAWGDLSGRCMETSAGAFVLNGNFWEFLKTKWPPY